MNRIRNTVPKDLFDPHQQQHLERGNSKTCDCCEDDNEPHLYFLWDGAVRAYRTTYDGKEITTGIYSTKLDWTLICTCGDHNHFEALRPSQYLKISVTSAARALARHPSMLEEVLHQILGGFESAFQAQENLALRDVPTRLVHLLLILGEQFGQSSQDGTQITLKLSQDKLAQMISASRPTVNIALKSLVDSGVISLKNKNITLLDIEKLKKLS